MQKISKQHCSVWYLLFLVMAAIGSVGLMQINASAAHIKYGYQFKSTRVKEYDKPNVPGKKAWYQRRSGNLKKAYVKRGEIREHGIQFIRLEQVSHQSVDSGQGRYQAFWAPFYVRRNSVHRIKLINNQSKVEKTAYFLSNSNYNFWKYPVSTNAAIGVSHWGSHYGQQQLYVVAQAMNRFKRTYFEVQNATGKKLGWINSKALKAGLYEEQISFLAKRLTFNQPIWYSKHERGVKVATACEQQGLSKIVIQNVDNAAIIVGLKDGQPISYSNVRPDHTEKILSQLMMPRILCRTSLTTSKVISPK